MRGTFVLASGIEGITDAVIDGENGYHLPAGDSRVWANTIHEVLRDKARLDMLSQKAKEYVKKNYSWDIMVEKYKEIFDSLTFSDTSPTISDTYRFNFPINKKRLPGYGQSI
jgi:phosphatidylinositol alpha-1,6-mannosyltransferase